MPVPAQTYHWIGRFKSMTATQRRALRVEQKQEFLRLLGRGHSVTACGKRIHVGEMTLVKWRLKDAEFAAEWDRIDRVMREWRRADALR